MEKMNEKFLLDENVPRKVKNLLISLGVPNTFTVQDLGWQGLKNGELSTKVKESNFVLITFDKDFTFLWEKYNISVIYIRILPSKYETIRPSIVKLFKNWNYDIHPFLLSLIGEEFRIRYK
jgi:predicted nuclease of predicted toxin-antitoxin system